MDMIAASANNSSRIFASAPAQLYAGWLDKPPRLPENPSMKTNPFHPDSFPILVWAQEPSFAEAYREIGINTFLSLWKGPTETQLQQVRDAGMFAICNQNDAGLADAAKPDSVIIGWLRGDEPDNLRKQPDGTSAPIPPKVVQEQYRKMRDKDPSRPIVVNFGQGVANDAFPGRGASFEDYPAYAEGADIISFDIYPVANLKVPGPDGQTILDPNGADHLDLIAKGIQRMRGFVHDRKPVWNVLECTHIHNPDRIATPEQIRSEAWISLIHGSRGICWFVHDFRKEEVNPAAVLDNPEMRQAVSEINHEILKFAPILNRPAVEDGCTCQTTDPESPVAVTGRETEESLHLFSVGMRNQPTKATFTLDAPTSATHVEVLGENRSLPLDEHRRFHDSFGPYQVHHYRISRQG